MDAKTLDLEYKLLNEKYVGKKYNFDPKEWSSELISEDVMSEEYFHTPFTVIGLEVYVNENLEDNYWNIKFDDGYELNAISGYHFTEI